VSESEYLPVAHDRFRHVERAIFVRRFVADCMSHTCTHVADEGVPLTPHKPLLDACCQYGADTDLGERNAILARRADIAPLLIPAARLVPWFEDTVEEDPDQPSGYFVRTAVFNNDGQDGCVFLAHDKRGCAIHRASIEQGWSFDGVKPHICRLFPLSYDSDTITISDDFVDYDCADRADAPTLYRVLRDTLGSVFGAALVHALDAVEATIAAAAPRSGAGLVELRANRAAST
jgi:Fe-S-cluster containining protein